MKKKKRIFNVYHVDKIVEPNGKIYIPKKFLDSLNIKAGDKVIVVLYLGDQTVRIRKKKVVYDVIYNEKTVDQTGKVHISKHFREKIGIETGNVVDVALYEDHDIRIKRIRSQSTLS